MSCTSQAVASNSSLGEAALRSTPGTLSSIYPPSSWGSCRFLLMPVTPLSSFYMHDDVVYIATPHG
jgi:hypothetical protein